MKHGRYYSALRSFCFILSFVTFLSIFPCLNVKASDLSDQLGMEQEEFDSILEEDKTITFDMPFTLEETGNYLIQEEIKVKTQGYEFYWEHKPYVTYTSYGTSDLAFGTTKVVTNAAQLVRMTLYNDDRLLFNQSGTLYLKLVAYSTKGTLKITKVGGTVSETSIACDPSDINAMIELEIPNTLADIIKIEILLNGPVKQGTGDNYLAGGIVKYGYVLTGGITDGSEHSKNIFELLKGFVANFWNNTMGSIANVFTFLTNFVSNFWTSFTEKLQSGYDYLTDSVSNLFEYLKDFVLGFWEDFKEKIELGFDYLTDNIKGLFVPDEEFVNDWLSDYYSYFVNKFGALGYMHNYILDLFNTFYNAEFGEPILTMPRMALTIPNYGYYVICEQQQVNLNNLVKDIPSAVNMLHFATSVIMTLALCGYGVKLKDEILR